MPLRMTMENKHAYGGNIHLLKPATHQHKDGKFYYLPTDEEDDEDQISSVSQITYTNRGSNIPHQFMTESAYNDPPRSARFEVQQVVQMRQWQKEKNPINSVALKPVHNHITTGYNTQSTNQILSGEHDVVAEKVETLENIIADKLRAINDLDNKLNKKRRGGPKNKQANSVEPPQSSYMFYKQQIQPQMMITSPAKNQIISTSTNHSKLKAHYSPIKVASLPDPLVLAMKEKKLKYKKLARKFKEQLARREQELTDLIMET